MFEGNQLPASRVSVPTRSPREVSAYAGRGGGDPTTGEQSTGNNLLPAIWRRRGVVLICLILALAGGVAYLMRAQKMYAASSVVLVQQPQLFMPNGFQSSIQISQGFMATQCQLILSTAILKDAIDQPGVADVPLLRGSENPVGYLKSACTATPAKLGDLMQLTMECPEPKDAAVIVNGIVQAYIGYQAKQNAHSAQALYTNLQGEYADREKDLNQRLAERLKLRQAHPEMNVHLNSQAMGDQQLSNLNAKLTEAEMLAGDLDRSLQTASATNPDDLATLHALIEQNNLAAQLPPAMEMQQASAAVSDLQSQLDRLNISGYGEGSLTVQRNRAMLDKARAFQVAAQRSYAAGCVQVLKTSVATAQAHVAELQKVLKEQKDHSTSLNAEEAEYEMLAERAQRDQQSMGLLDDQMRKISGAETSPAMTINVLETAKPSLLPVRPLASHVLGFAGLGGLILGAALGLLFDRVDQRLRSVEEVANLLDATVLGVVPRIVRRVLPGEAGREIQLKPRSSVSEAFRTVRTAIYFGGADRAGKTILVTSPTPGDGKSTCISNLAIAIAQGGRRTLLIDADCRRPVQHKTFELGEGPGLSSILVGKSTLDEAVRHTAVERLDVLPCGPLPHNPAELLDSQALLDLLGEAARKYDQVLIDSPPVTLVSDARVLAASCDAAFLVVRHERSTRRGATLAWNALSSVGANLLGVVVNDLARQKDGYGYSYYGYGRYGYSPAKPNPELSHNGNGQPTAVVAAVADDDDSN